ncbi:hypothetical protein LEMLEM_LOCUS19904 [Lemmus lemmus]
MQQSGRNVKDSYQHSSECTEMHGIVSRIPLMLNQL